VSGFQLFPRAASTFAARVDLITIALVGLSALVLLGLFGIMIYFCVRYRANSRAARPSGATKTLRFELTWTILPLLISLAIFGWAGTEFLRLKSPPPGAERVYVVGKQWMWKFQHEDGRRELDILHVPVGQPIELVMTSEDVIHSLFIPAFRVKQDLLPGRFTSTWFTATEAGEFHLFCTQYCGAHHAGMGQAWVIAMEPDRYSRWKSDWALAGNSAAAHVRASNGRRLFNDLGCALCHMEATGTMAPRLEGVYGSKVTLEGGGQVVADEQYLRESILEPNAKIVQGFSPIMPNFSGLVTGPELEDLVTYLKSLRLSDRYAVSAGIPGER
jgi:cytochrome c oxidase subunit 2